MVWKSKPLAYVHILYTRVHVFIWVCTHEVGALLASATVPGLCVHACTHECLVVVMERGWSSEHMSEVHRWRKGATVFIARYLASITEVTSTVKVPIVSSLKSIKYKTIILYLFDTALVVWVKDSKVWGWSVCECVGRRVWWWSVESKLSVSLHSAFSQLLPSVRSYCVWTCDPWWQGVQ